MSAAMPNASTFMLVTDEPSIRNVLGKIAGQRPAQLNDKEMQRLLTMKEWGRPRDEIVKLADSLLTAPGNRLPGNAPDPRSILSASTGGSPAANCRVPPCGAG